MTGRGWIILVVLGAVLPASAQWQLIDNFQQWEDGRIFTDATGIGWHATSVGDTDEYWFLANPFESNDIAMYVEAGNYGIHAADVWCQKALPGDGIAPGETGTLFWRGLWSDIGKDKYNPYSWYLGTADRALEYDPESGNQTAPGAWDDFNAVIRLGETQHFEHWNGDGYVPTDPPVLADEQIWYNFWMVVENSWNIETNPPICTGRYSLYLQSPEDPLPVLLPVGGDPSGKASFQRFPTDPQGFPQAIIWLQFGTASGAPSPSSSGNPFLLDDFYFSQGENLSSPLDWAGYSIELSGDVDTGTFLGWINVTQAPYIWSYSLNGWIYMEEPAADAPGAWGYFFK